MFIVSLFGLTCLILYTMRGMYLLEENIFEMDVEPPTFQNGFQKQGGRFKVWGRGVFVMKNPTKCGFWKKYPYAVGFPQVSV